MALLDLCAETPDLSAFAAPGEADGNCGLAVDIFLDFAQHLTSTGGQCSATLPDAPVNGQVAIFKALGVSNTDGVKVTPGAGQSLEDPGNLGNFSPPTLR